MRRSIYDGDLVDKLLCYERYKTIVPFAKNYDEITRHEMIETVLNVYSNVEHLLVYILTDQELEILKEVKGKIICPAINKNHQFLVDIFLYVNDETGVYYELAREFVDYVDAELAYYEEYKEEIELQKYPSYLLLGLLRAYGALSFKEVERLLGQYGVFEEASLANFLDRFICANNYYEAIGLREHANAFAEILATHSDNFKSTYTIESIISMAKNVFDETSFEYLEMIQNEKYKSVLTNLDRRSVLAAVSLGNSNVDTFRYLDYSNNLEEDEYVKIVSYFETLPHYLLDKEEN